MSRMTRSRPPIKLSAAGKTYLTEEASQGSAEDEVVSKGSAIKAADTAPSPEKPEPLANVTAFAGTKGTDGADGASKHQELVPQFSRSELVLSEMIGKGGFSLVFRLELIGLEDTIEENGEPEQPQDESHNQDSGRFSLAQSCASGKGHYVVKSLRPDLPRLGRRHDGAYFVKKEAQILASLQHENIIRLRGVGRDCFSKAPTNPQNLFLLLDECSEQFLERMESWREQARKHSVLRLLPHCHRKHASALKQLFAERLQVGIEVASALSYLHSKNIVFLDTKPENLGFCNGTLKLFDFGLAKPLVHATTDSYDAGTYQQTSFAGTHPYLSPEVALFQPYGLAADVYSFAIVLWEILAIQEPFRDIMRHVYIKKVLRDGFRPKINKRWPAAVQQIIQASWQPEPTDRPTMENVPQQLQQALRAYNA